MADRGSYFVTIYRETDTTWRREKEKRNKDMK